MNTRHLLRFAALLIAFTFHVSAAAPTNIVLIYADDVGYGDFSCYGATAVKTPNVDRIANEGLRFTNAYCSSATCTPSRYSLLTGEYAFRKKGTGVLPGDAPLVIAPGTHTLPAILQKAGFVTAAIGKWHLGLGTAGLNLDWNGPIRPGPLEVGFNYCFIMPATGDRVPCVYVEDHQVVGLDPADPIEVNYKHRFPDIPTAVEIRDSLSMDFAVGHNNAVVNGIGRIGFMKGGKAALWKDEDMADTYTRKALQFIDKNRDKSFFLYFATHDIHVPRVPHPRFVGKTSMGPRGDAIVQFDACVGEILHKLDQLALTDNTLIILSSDNGPVLNDGYKDGAVPKLGNHKPAGPLRGGKYSIFEGGTRVPFIVRWPSRIKPGVSTALISQVDLCASLGTLTGTHPDASSNPDSENVLPALLGESSVGRDHIVEHAGRLALREADWKFIEPAPRRNASDQQSPEPKGSLFDLASDPAESTDLASSNPEKAAELAARLKRIRSGRDTAPPSPKQ